MAQAFLVVPAPHPLGLAVDAESLDGIARFPGLGLAGLAVHAGIVGRGVRPAPVGHGLDERRPLARTRPGRRLGDDVNQGQHVVAVDEHALHAIGYRLLRQGRRGGLDRTRRGDGPPVVAQEEHARRLVHGGQVARHVEVAGRGRAVAEVDQAARAMPTACGICVSTTELTDTKLRSRAE